ncbi:MAG TPA: GEVED domain-containing protein, partial [Tahibacter sp.]|nr:GEVED domain-containing protein [Tahibacter sp.]
MSMKFNWGTPRTRGTLALLLAAASSTVLAGTPAITLDDNEVVEYWYWASGVVVTGNGFAATSSVTVTDTDPTGATRQFAAATDASGAFSVRINALKIRSVLGQHVISVADPQSNTAQAPLSIVSNPDDILNVKATPETLPIGQFGASGTQIHIDGLTPNGRVRINLGDPADNTGELMTTTQLFADANGAFDFLLDPTTQIWGAGVGKIVPVEGVWSLSAFDMAGGNNHFGTVTFRMLPDDPNPNAYCAVDMSQSVEPITYVGFAGIDQASPVDSMSGYEDFTSVQGHVKTGRTYPIRLKGKADASFDANTYTVFVDWNRDGILDGAGEVESAGYLIGSTGSDGMEVVHDITVPGSAVGGPTRMRVLKVYSPSSFAFYWPSGACGFYRWGQVEDYTLDVERVDAIFAAGFEAATSAPTLAKAFASASVPTNTPTRLTITLTNTNATPATLTADLVDTFPGGMVSAASASTTCTGGQGIAQTGTSVTLRSGAVIPASGSCTIGVDVAAQTAGTLTNTIPAGGLVTDAGSSADAATATLTAITPVVPPTLAKTFPASSVPTNTPTRLTITLTNSNSTPARLTADLVDAFPSGMVSAANASTTCTGTLGQTGTSVTLLSGALIPALSSCAINVDVAAQVAGQLVNTIPAGGLVTDAGSNANAASATLTVTAPVVAPTLAKTFAAASVPTNTPTRLTITLTNGNATPATLTADLVDAFPSGMVSAANASTTCTGSSLGQTGTSVTLRSGAVIPASGSCTVAVDIAAQTAGSLTNTIPAGGLATNAGNNANAASATLTVTT